MCLLEIIVSSRQTTRLIHSTPACMCVCHLSMHANGKFPNSFVCVCVCNACKQYYVFFCMWVSVCVSGFKRKLVDTNLESASFSVQ